MYGSEHSRVMPGTPNSGDTLEAAYTAWSESDLALFLSDVVERTGNMAGRDGAQFELACLSLAGGGQRTTRLQGH